MNWLADNVSNFLQVSDPEETAVSWPEADLRRIYSQHVRARVLPFRTHLPSTHSPRRPEVGVKRWRPTKKTGSKLPPTFG